MEGRTDRRKEGRKECPIPPIPISRLITMSLSDLTSTWKAINLKKNKLPQLAVNLSPQYGHVILVSGYLVLTGVN